MSVCVCVCVCVCECVSVPLGPVNCLDLGWIWVGSVWIVILDWDSGSHFVWYLCEIVVSLRFVGGLFLGDQPSLGRLVGQLERRRDRVCCCVEKSSSRETGRQCECACA
ncbi:hypothetical protein DFJ73DRAFT_847261 [Zopfochytrium polystomum]|nr:hypothetical protein DFJ73DRAFT_847261 [Zopfochytrium polystomum]